jgi:DNA-binding protein H-NS
VPKISNTQKKIDQLKKELELLIRNSNLTKKRDKALEKIVSIAKQNGISADEVSAALGSSRRGRKPGKVAKSGKAKRAGKRGGKRGKVKPKYRNPANPAQTWAGRGLSPLWFKALKAEGKEHTALIGGGNAK